MKTLPLFYYPSTWLWIDDDRNALKSMTLVFEDQGNILPFQSAKSCLEFLSKYEPPLTSQTFLKSITAHESYGSLRKNPIDFDITTIANLADVKNRHDEITVMVIDYHMPEMDGFELAKATQHLPIQKILLTGKAQESDAVAGFNDTLIHRFVQKAEEKQFEKLSSYLKELSLQYFEKLTYPLLANLETEILTPLSDPIFIDFFKGFCDQYKITEYYLVDKQGSFLCIDEKNNKSCLVVISDEAIENWLFLNSKEPGLSANDLNAIIERKKIPFFGVGKEAWQFNTSFSQFLYSSEVLNGRKKYFWAKVDKC